jgi:hypothetical protein
MTSKRPVTHPALHAALNDGVWRDAAIAPPGAPRESLGGAEASSGTTGRGEGADAADGRTAVLIGAVQAAAQAITEEASAGWRTCTPLGFAKALAEAGLLRDDADLTSPHVEIGGQRMTEAQFLAARMPLHNDIEGLEAEVARFKGQRDDLLAMKARVEALADVWRPGETRRITTRLAARILRAAIRGDR